jgi:hypothetical protein
MDPGILQPMDFLGQVCEVAQQQRGNDQRCPGAQVRKLRAAGCEGLRFYHERGRIEARNPLTTASQLEFHCGSA